MAVEETLSTTLPKKKVVEEMIVRLLQKAGTDPRVTPRLLRKAAEQRLMLQSNVLKPMRDDIKNMIMSWHEKRMEVVSQDIKLMVKLAKAAGVDPILYEDIRELDDRDEIKKLLRERLKEIKLEFSDPPTQDEIAAAKKKAGLKNELESLEGIKIVESKRKRSDNEESDAKKRTKNSNDKAENESTTTAVINDSATPSSSKKAKYEEIDEVATFA